MWPGNFERQKKRLADAIANGVMSVLDYGEESVSVSIEEVPAKDWAKEVYGPDIEHGRGKLYKKSGYSM
jgi:4-oxalocrotonate tautomerase